MTKHCAVCGKKKPLHGMGWKFVEKRESLARTVGQIGLELLTGIRYRRGWWVCKDCYNRL